jgi:hypothetical protein
VFNYLPRDPRHIWYLPCEDIKIVLEKSDEREFLFGIEAYTNPELLVRVAGVSQDLLVVSPLLLIVHQLIG